MNRTLLSLAAIAACLAIFLALNIVGATALRGARADLTDDELYTLSKGSRDIARKIDEPIKLTLYYSEKQANGLPEIKSYATRVREFLQEFANTSGGKVKVEFIDPEPFSEAEDRASQAGLFGLQTGKPGERLYFGLIGSNSTGTEQNIPFFDSRKEEFLEYDLTRMIYLLSSPAKKTIGIMASLPINGVQDNPMMRGQDTPPWQVAAQLKDLFEVKNVAPAAEEIPADIKVLMVVHPKSLSDKTQYAIDQFVLRGGSLMVFVDPWCESDVPPGINPMQAMQLPKASGLPKLFDAWGVEMVPERFAADRDSAITVNAGSQNLPEPLPAVFYLDLRKAKDCFSTSDSVTGQLDHMTMGIAGVLQKKPDATITFEPLIKTTPKAQAMDVKLVQFVPDAKRLLAEFKPEDRPLTLAARLSGKVKTAFPAGDPAPAPEPKEGEAPKPPAQHLAESQNPDGAHIIVVADCDMLTDRFWVNEARFGNVSLGWQKFADNGDFIIHSLDHLSGSSDLMSLRARGKSARPFDRVESIQKEAQDKYLKRVEELQNSERQLDTRINEILRQTPQGSTTVILTPEQQADIEKFKTERIAIRKQLRDVKHQMQRDIDSLGTRMKFINIALMPLAVGLAAVGLSLYRANRRRSYKAKPVPRS